MSDVQEALLSLYETPADDYSKGHHGYSMKLYEDGNRVERYGYSDPVRASENVIGSAYSDMDTSYNGGVISGGGNKKVSKQKLAKLKKMLKESQSGGRSGGRLNYGILTQPGQHDWSQLRPFDMSASGMPVSDSVMNLHQMEANNRIAGSSLNPNDIRSIAGSGCYGSGYGDLQGSGLFGSIFKGIGSIAQNLNPIGLATSIAAPIVGKLADKAGNAIANKIAGKGYLPRTGRIKGSSIRGGARLLLDDISRVGRSRRERDPQLNGNFWGQGLLTEQQPIRDAVMAPHPRGYTTLDTLKRLLRDPNLPSILGKVNGGRKRKSTRGRKSNNRRSNNRKGKSTRSSK